jgi:hypothetical protein
MARIIDIKPIEDFHTDGPDLEVTIQFDREEVQLWRGSKGNSESNEQRAD